LDQPNPAGAQPATPASPAAEAERGGPRTLEGEPGVENRLSSVLGRTDDPLKIGGLLYLRSNVNAREHTPPSQWTLTAPALTDIFLDARPLDRVRGFVLGRMFFDPTQTASSTGLASEEAPPPNPQVLLDQLWLSFDLGRTAFVTLGRQHVKWGVGRFWNPTDYLHAVRRDPLTVFDARTGTYMARVNLPWERYGWSITGVVVFEPLVTQAATTFITSVAVPAGSTTTTPAGTPSNQLAGVGGGGRAELVLGSWEFGVDGVAQRGMRPRLGVDVSGGLWEIDFKGELSLRKSSDVTLYRGTLASFGPYEPSGVRPAAVLAAEWSHKYSDEDSFTLGFEYFYNSNGYVNDQRALYPVLILANAFTSFYLGRHYGGAYLSLTKPGGWNLHTFTLSAISNLSDQSSLVRFDWSMTFLTYLTLEVYVQGHLGTSDGEFRLGINLPNLGETGSPSVSIGAQTVDLGLALRLNL
ncbi:MAG: hypothetical protein A2V77_18695, partial [Anaeromyxobacter sp. RBG_16_69_14]